ncbi:carbohydrate-binding module family 18 protein [Chaetomidium leptoderma]|uniref:Carbohydrate-binding module family 18 protein n=1 Tax=Chaetomidium leptoderma TaxID=669021 RepID=A0AAN6ZTQ6_9PEZI|nr:carbohydrate-binding module family 18 protein [Chaetomidium leptoderma]
MVASLLTKSFLLLALGFSHQAAAACTRSVTAKQGDTCASLSSQAGITVTEFLRSNPSVTSCSQLTAGGSYCVAGTADGGSSSSARPPVSSTPSDLQVSVDGTCGQGVTCEGSRFGNCCSAHGYCGGTSDYCGDGCQSGFGTCGAGSGETSQGPPAGSVTVTVTSITDITRTSVVTVTQTQTRTAATATVTQTVRTTATVPVTETSTIKLTSIVTSIVTSLRTSTTIRTVNVTSLSIDTITSIVTSTRLVTSVACDTTPTRTTGRPTTTTEVTGRPTLPGTPSYCKNYDQIQDDDTCRSIADRNRLSLLNFYQLNPSVSATVLNLGGLCTPEFIELVLSGLCQINCDALWEGYYVCVGR